MEPVLGCSGCAGTAGRSGCWIHGPQAFSVGAALTALNHRHDWKMLGQLADGQVLLCCPDHDPPETRTVRP
jgi:hypothetical protein